MAEGPTSPPPLWNGSATVEPEDIYRVYFHGPAFQVLDCAWRDGERAVGRLRTPLPPCSREGDTLVAAPRLVELCFQTAGVLEIGTQGRMGLPTGIEKLWIDPGPDLEAGPTHAIVTPRSDGRFDAEVVDADGRVRIRMQGYATTQLPVAVDDELARWIAQSYDRAG